MLAELWLPLIGLVLSVQYRGFTSIHNMGAASTQPLAPSSKCNTPAQAIKISVETRYFSTYRPVPSETATDSSLTSGQHTSTLIATLYHPFLPTSIHKSKTL